MIVDAEALNLRSAPEIDPENRIGILNIGQWVKPIEEDVPEGWAKVSVEIGGGERTGYVTRKYLRQPVSDAREELVGHSIRQWLRFEMGQGLEFEDPYFRHVGEMWEAIGMNLDGRDRDVPWSAAAISYIIRKAGAAFAKYRKFRFAAAHSRYIHDAIAKRTANDADAPFWGFRLHEQRPQLGDMVCRWRETPRDFDDAVVQDSFKSHCDIIVRITSDEVFAIGGNVKHSVSVTRYEKTPAGFLADSNQVFAHLVNRVS